MFGFGASGKVVTSEQKIDNMLNRFVDEVIDKEHLKQRLESGQQLRIKLGIDPTSPHLHLGRAVSLLVLRDFQELGHKIVLIIGNATGVIGDTSDKESERPMLDRSQVEKNAKTYLAQAGRLLELKKVEVKYNATWFDKLTFQEIGELADQFSVADFIARDNIKRRLQDGKRVSLREVLYPVMQGYDSVMVQADVEIGGTDQRFNLLAGRALQEHAKQKPQDVLMTKLIPGTDGRKMSSSWGNGINITDEPADMYGKVMRTSDAVMRTYFEACTRVPLSEIETVLSGNPRDAKMRLAREIVTLYHGETVAQQAEEQFVKTFQKGEVSDELALEVVMPKGRPDEALMRAGVISSKSEFQRLLRDGAVINVTTGEKMSGSPFEITADCTLRIGKKRFVKIKIA
ncbi:MAG TPA: tyrosine--tRNA ligase [Candidatus Paceibacterota bacterium]|jgi:tyrosyl-tRNA synthetase